MKKRLTLERHNEIGTELKAIDKRLGDIFIEVSKAYPLQSKQVVWLQKTLKNLWRVRSGLDDEMYREHGAVSQGVYCGRKKNELQSA